VDRLRTGANAALLIVSLIAIFEPAWRGGPLRWVVLTLFLVVAAESTWRSYRAGDLTKTFGQLLRNPPKTNAFEFLAFVCGTIALVLVLDL
jgi:hypothetical protein